MTWLKSPENLSLVDLLGRQFFLGRSCAHLPWRHGILHEKKHLEALSNLSGRDPGTLAARGRLLRLLGRLQEARSELGEALRLSAPSPEAWAWRWELESSLGRGKASDLDQAIALEPENGWWRLWRAIRFLEESCLKEALRDSEAALERIPGQALAHVARGLVWFKGREFRRACRSLEEGLRLKPRLEWGLRLRAVCRYELGDLEGCLEDCFGAMRLNEMIGTLFIPLGLTQRKLGTRENIEAATRFIRRHPKAFWAYVYRSDYKREPAVNENASALQDLMRAIELKPDCAWAWAYLTRCQTAMGDFQGARRSIEQAVALDPGCGWAMAWRGEHLRRLGDIQGASDSLDKAVRLGPDYELAYAWRGSVRRLLGRPQEAIEDLNIAIRLKPTYSEWCYFERMNAHRALGLVGEALRDLEQAHALNPKFLWENEPKRFGKALKELDQEIRRSPKDPLPWVWRGDIMMRLRDFAQAARDLTRALRLDPRHAGARILRGRALGELKRWRKAFSDFNAAIRQGGGPFAYAWRGRARMLKADHRGAVSDFARALLKEKASAWILSWKGESEFRLGRTQAAVSDLSKALEVHFRYAEAYLWRGASRLFLKDHKGAWADLTQALTIQPENALAHAYRGVLHLETGRRAEALEDLTKALERARDLPARERRLAREALKRLREAGKDDKASLFEQAQRMQKEGQHEAAAQIYTKLLSRKPSPELLRKRAEAFRCLGRQDLALKDWDGAFRLSRKTEDLISLGDARRHVWDFEGALKDSLAAIQRDPKAPYGWVLKSECERSLGRYEEAISSATRAILCEPGWSWAYVVRAKAKRQKGDLEDAIADTRQAEKVHRDAYAWGWRGEILRKAGRPKEALRELIEAITMQPSNAWFMALRGETYRELGSFERALSDLQEASRLDPHCSCAFDILGAEPQNVRQDPKLAWVYAWRGGILRKEGRLAQARSDLERAASLDPCFWILAWKGELSLHEGKTQAALADLEAALSLYPQYTQARIWKGQALLALGRTAEALSEFRLAHSQEPQNVWSLIGQSACLEKTGKASKARELLEQARRIAPSLFETVKA